MLPETRFGDEVSAVIPRLAGALARLDPGGLARLRRMDLEGPGEAAFWQLAVEIDLPGDRSLWLHPVRLMALLTPRGDPRAGKQLAHDARRPLGTALAEAGFSETRLLRLIECAPEKRGDALERMVRFLATRGAGSGVNCRDIFWLLHARGPAPLRRLADQYFRTRARTTTQTEEEAA
jgi:CRISPR system Cascade subunit CasB